MFNLPKFSHTTLFRLVCDEKQKGHKSLVNQLTGTLSAKVAYKHVQGKHYSTTHLLVLFLPFF